MLLYIYGLCISSLDQVVQLPTTEEDKALKFYFSLFSLSSSEKCSGDGGKEMTKSQIKIWQILSIFYICYFVRKVLFEYCKSFEFEMISNCPLATTPLIGKPFVSDPKIFVQPRFQYRRIFIWIIWLNIIRKGSYRNFSQGIE